MQVVVDFKADYINSIYMHLRLSSCVQYDPEEEERQAQAKKRARLDKLEQRWKAEQQESRGGWWFLSSFTSFPSSIVENLQV